jgi:hypothetical protein
MHFRGFTAPIKAAAYAHVPAMRFAPIIILITCLLTGCLTPVDVGTHRDLSHIQREFDRVVADIHEREDEQWYSDWYGNFLVNGGGDEARGLCWHWQEAVYMGMKPVIDAMGWQTVGMVLNGGQRLEHHAVLVFDPKRIKASEILTRKPPRPVWVLDAWRHGKSEIYHLDSWLKYGAILATTAEIEDLDSIVRSAQSQPASEPESKQ